MVPNYRGNEIGYAGKSPVVTVSVYNGTGSAIAKGVPKILCTKADATLGVYLYPLTCATNTAVANIIGVPLAAHADATWQEYQISGLCEYSVTSGSVAVNDMLQVINAGVSFIDEGTNGGAIETSDCVALAVEEVSTYVWKLDLLGKQVSVAAS